MTDMADMGDVARIGGVPNIWAIWRYGRHGQYLGGRVAWDMGDMVDMAIWVVYSNEQSGAPQRIVWGSSKLVGLHMSV